VELDEDLRLLGIDPNAIDEQVLALLRAAAAESEDHRPVTPEDTTR
jgi:hypothetical protein